MLVQTVEVSVVLPHPVVYVHEIMSNTFEVYCSRCLLQLLLDLLHEHSVALLRA